MVLIVPVFRCAKNKIWYRENEIFILNCFERIEVKPISIHLTRIKHSIHIMRKAWFFSYLKNQSKRDLSKK